MKEERAKWTGGWKGSSKMKLKEGMNRGLGDRRKSGRMKKRKGGGDGEL